MKRVNLSRPIWTNIPVKFLFRENVFLTQGHRLQLFSGCQEIAVLSLNGYKRLFATAIKPNIAVGKGTITCITRFPQPQCFFLGVNLKLYNYHIHLKLYIYYTFI